MILTLGVFGNFSMGSYRFFPAPRQILKGKIDDFTIALVIGQVLSDFQCSIKFNKVWILLIRGKDFPQHSLQ